MPMPPMSSAGLCAALGVSAGGGGGDDRTLCITRARSEAGEPAEQLGVLVPFGQVGGNDVGVDGFEGFAFGLGGGPRVDLGGGWVVVEEEETDVGQRNAGVVEVHGPAVQQDVRAEAGVGERRSGCPGFVLAKDPGDG